MDVNELKARVEAIDWYHSIDLGHGIRTRGVSENIVTPTELPEMAGRSVLDVGAWDGRYSFLAEQAGASRVVALDHYAWCVDLVARNAYWRECQAAGTRPDLEKDLTEFWRPEAPGRRGFDLAREALGSTVEPVVGDFMTMDLDTLAGPFDVVLLLGVLYHLKEPLTALERLGSITSEVLVVETEAVRLEGYDDGNLLLFCPADEFGADFTNWFVPTEKGLHALCKAAGFGRVVTKRAHGFENLRRPWHVPGLVPGTRAYRLVVHAYRR